MTGKSNSRSTELLSNEAVRHPEHMMNVTPVWDMGYKGKGVITALIDDGLDSDSDDLKDNFVS